MGWRVQATCTLLFEKCGLKLALAVRKTTTKVDRASQLISSMIVAIAIYDQRWPIYYVGIILPQVVMCGEFFIFSFPVLEMAFISGELFPNCWPQTDLKSHAFYNVNFLIWLRQLLICMTLLLHHSTRLGCAWNFYLSEFTHFLKWLFRWSRLISKLLTFEYK